MVCSRAPHVPRGTRRHLETPRIPWTLSSSQTVPAQRIPRSRARRSLGTWWCHPAARRFEGTGRTLSSSDTRQNWHRQDGNNIKLRPGRGCVNPVANQIRPGTKEIPKDELNQDAASPQPFNLANYHCFTFSQMSMVHGLALPQTSSKVLAPRS